jgi:hypothetical protein
VSTIGAKSFDGLRQRRLFNVAEHQIGLGGSEALRGGETNSARPARDDRSLSF